MCGEAGVGPRAETARTRGPRCPNGLERDLEIDAAAHRSDRTIGAVDRFHDLLARRVGEISSDITEIQSQLSGLVRVVREDAGGVQRLSGQLRSQITRARMVPVGRLFAPFVRMVREASRAAGKSVSLEIRGETVEMDTTIVELMADPLVHLVRNAIAHGIESEDTRRQLGKPPQGTLHLGAAHKGGSIYIEVADDGRGIDIEAVSEAARRGGFLTAETIARLGERDLVDLIFLPGLTTATSVTTAAGRGVGMDVVRANVGRLGGEIEVQTEAGRGTRFRIRLPLTVAISDALMVRVGAEVLAIPVPAVKAAIGRLDDRARLVLRLWLVSGSTLANIGKAFGITQQTVSRWLADARDQILKDVQRNLSDCLKLARDELPSIARLISSQLDISISRILGKQSA